ncbi:hypothetical protein [Oceanobacillus caeni]|uniref:hypothetical protein n=1 Tax=Oceanobacillus caeni TaxID=405946 RepID=UPI0011B760BC
MNSIKILLTNRAAFYSIDGQPILLYSKVKRNMLNDGMSGGRRKKSVQIATHRKERILSTPPT